MCLPSWLLLLRECFIRMAYDIGGNTMGVKGLPALRKLVITRVHEWCRVERSVVGFLPRRLPQITGSGVCPRGCFLSFECLLKRAYDIDGSTLGVKGLRELSM